MLGHIEQIATFRGCWLRFGFLREIGSPREQDDCW